jgi:hypothetical protein
MGKDLFKEIRRIATKLGESFGKIKESFEKIKEIEKFVKIIGAQKFKTLGYGIRDLNEGLDAGIINLPQVINIFFEHVGTIFSDFGDFLKTYMECGLRGLKNFESCFPFYFLQILGIIIYFICIQIWVLIFQLQKYERMVWDKIHIFNNWQRSNTDFDFLKYPTKINKLCYQCEGGTLMKPKEFIETVKRHGHTLFHNSDIHRLMVENSLDKMNKGARNIRNFFQKTKHEEQEHEEEEE